MNILAIESSCDETAAAIVRNGTEIIASSVASSTAMHETWGGIVPEVAARMQLEYILPVILDCLSQASHNKPENKPMKQLSTFLPYIESSIDSIAVTVGPGLVGSLLIGIEAAKMFAFLTHKPMIPVNHVLAHMYANFIHTNQDQTPQLLKEEPKSHIQQSTIDNQQHISFPAISLVVSGGHTELFLMKDERTLQWLGGTIDDAAGECFDKSARILGFGAGGGVAIQSAANRISTSSSSQPHHTDNQAPLRLSLPRPLLHDKSLNFSFSGLKTALMREVHTLKNSQQLNDISIQHVAFELQESITDVLVRKTLKAAEAYNARSILISGGVASNTRLREKFIQTIHRPPTDGGDSSQFTGLTFYCPPISLCTDNAITIASYAYFRGKQTDLKDIFVQPDMEIEVVQ